MASQTEQKDESRPKEQIVDPWRAVAGEGQATIDYNKLIGTLIQYDIGSTFEALSACMCIIRQI